MACVAATIQRPILWTGIQRAAARGKKKRPALGRAKKIIEVAKKECFTHGVGTAYYSLVE